MAACIVWGMLKDSTEPATSGQADEPPQVARVRRTASRIRLRLEADATASRDAKRCAGRRIAFLMARARYLADRREAVPHWVDRAIHDVERVRTAIDSGSRIVALDTGLRNGRFLDEVGVSTWIHGVVETVTYADVAARYRNPDDSRRVMEHPLQVHVKARFGPTELVENARLRELAAEAAEDADLVVFHGAVSDMHALDMTLHAEKVVDTARISRAAYGRSLSLVELCATFGIDGSGNHNSGNDARYALDCALATTVATLPILRERSRVVAQKADVLHDAVMWPTRKPGGIEAAERYVALAESAPWDEPKRGTAAASATWRARLTRLVIDRLSDGQGAGGAAIGTSTPSTGREDISLNERDEKGA